MTEKLVLSRKSGEAFLFFFLARRRRGAEGDQRKPSGVLAPI